GLLLLEIVKHPGQDPGVTGQAHSVEKPLLGLDPLRGSSFRQLERAAMVSLDVVAIDEFLRHRTRASRLVARHQQEEKNESGAGAASHGAGHRTAASPASPARPARSPG